MIPLALDREFLKLNVQHYINWNYAKLPHLLVFGATGSGKTYFVKQVLARVGLHIPAAQIYICDFKADDFRFLDGTTHYYQFMECTAGLQVLFETFQLRQQRVNTSRSFILLMFDEWASYLNTIADKKTAEAEKMKLATLLMLGRSFNVHVLISQQRADAAYFNTARDNFNLIVALGNISSESKQMFFSGFKEDIKPENGQGQGYLLENGSKLRSIQVPTIRNEKKLEFYIKKAVSDS